MHQKALQQSAGRLAVAFLACVPVAVLALCGLGGGDEELAWSPAIAAAAVRIEAPVAIAADRLLPAQRELSVGSADALGADAAARGVVRGRVVDVDGTGLAGVAVGTAPAADRPSSTATSGDDGVFAIAMRPAMSHLVAIDPRWETVQAARPRTAGSVTIVVAERIALHGSVVDAAGAPIAGAMLAVVPPPSLVGEGVARQWLTFSAADGAFTFAAVPALPTARLLTQHPGLLADDRELPLRATNGLVVQLQAEPPCPPVLGTVFGPDGAPLAGAMARLGDALAHTDAEGAFRLLPSRATAPGTPLFVYASGCTPVQLPDPRPSHDLAPALQTVLLRPAVAIRGRIVDAAGAPARDWIVTLADPTPLRADASEASVEGQLGGVRAVTDADGAFCFANVFERAYTLEAWACHGGGVLRATLSPGSGLMTLTAAPQPEGERRGIVLDENGQPVAGVVVGEARPGHGQVHGLGMRFDERATTDAAGRFTLARAGAALHLLADGEAIVPVRVAVAANAAPEALLTVRVRRRCELRVSGEVAAAVAVASVDADGTEQPACGDAAYRLGVAASASALVVHRHGVAIGRLPLVGARRDVELCVQGPAAARIGR